MGHHHKHHKHCKYSPTVMNTDKVMFPAGHSNRSQGIKAFCEGIKAFPIGKRHCR